MMIPDEDQPPVESRPNPGSALIERIIRQVGVSSSAETVYGRPVEAHGRTVVPVARVYFMYGGGSGPEVAGRMLEPRVEGRNPPSFAAGGGGGGLGIARPAGYIEISEEGSRFVPATRDWVRPLVLAAATVVGLLALRGRR